MALQNAIQASGQPDLPSGDAIFAVRAPTNMKSARCHMPIGMIHCSATVPGAGVNGVDVVLTGDTYILKKENKDWIQQHLTYFQSQTKDTQDLNLAS